ncbi:hypothetical protein KJ633_07040 [bacterium]|nr:hypothetical protein [bacterium]
MRKITLILLVGIMFFSGSVEAWPWKKTDKKQEEPKAKAAMHDVAQSTEIAKKAEPKLLWKKKFDGEVKSFSAFYDGRYIAVALNESDYIKKAYRSKLVLLNKSGGILWDKELEGSIGGVRLFNNSLKILAHIGYEFMVLNDKGFLLWKKIISEGNVAIISPDDGYIATIDASYESSPSELNMYSKDGSLLWKNSFKWRPWTARFISEEIIAIVKPISEKILSLILCNTHNGQEVFQNSFEIKEGLQYISEIALVSSNIIKISLDSYPSNEEIRVNISEIAKVKNIKKKKNISKHSYSSEIKIKFNDSSMRIRANKNKIFFVEEQYQ